MSRDRAPARKSGHTPQYATDTGGLYHPPRGPPRARPAGLAPAEPGHGAGLATGTAIAIGAGLAAAAVAHAGPGVTALGPVRRALFPRLAGQGAAGHVALTFDDGPDPASTPGFLDLLDSRGLRATFFLLGSMVAKAPWLAAEIAAAGHEIGVHGWDHRYLALRGPRATRDDLPRATDIIADATGRVPGCSGRRTGC